MDKRTLSDRLMLKLGIDDPPGLVKFAIRARILPPGS